MTEPRVAVEDVVRIAQMIAAGEIDHDEANELLDLLSVDTTDGRRERGNSLNT